MNENNIRNNQSKQIVTKNICNYETETEVTVTYDTGMMKEYANQLGRKNAWLAGGHWCFNTENLMNDVARYFGTLNGCEPATERQIQYLISLGVKLEAGLTKERASQLITFAKNGEGVGCVGGEMQDGSY
jgi:hypothetical protein